MHLSPVEYLFGGLRSHATVAWAATLLKPLNIKNKKYHKDKKVKNYKSKKKKNYPNTKGNAWISIPPYELSMKFLTIWDTV